MYIMAHTLAQQRHCSFMPPPLVVEGHRLIDFYQDSTRRYMFSRAQVPVVVQAAFERLMLQEKYSSPYSSLPQHIEVVEGAYDVMVLDASSLWDWGHMRTRMSIWAELPEVHAASGLLHSEWLNHAASEVLQQQTYQRIPEAVGVHLRGGDFQRACRSALNQFVSLLFVCIETDTQAVI